MTRRRTAGLAALTLAAGLLASGCQSLDGQPSDVRNDIVRLDRQVQELRQTQARGDVGRRVGDMERITQQLNQQLDQMRRSQADLVTRLDTLRQEVQTLTGRFEETKYLAQRATQGQDQVQRATSQLTAMDQRVKELGQQIDTLRQSLDQLRRAQSGPPQGTAARPPASPQAQPAPTGRPAGGQPTEALYQEGFEFFRKGEFGKARDRFEAFLKANPNSDFAEGALYFVAETYFAEKDFENAILRYEEVVARFPKGSKVPTALFQQGMAFKELGAPKDARLLFQKVLDGYPNSTEAKLARAELPKLPSQ